MGGEGRAAAGGVGWSADILSAIFFTHDVPKSGQDVRAPGHRFFFAAPRDTDMQAAGLGEPIERDALRRGDLVFWKGHVAIMEDFETIIHANGHTMTVARENFAAAVERIGWLYEQPTGFRRPLL